MEASQIGLALEPVLVSPVSPKLDVLATPAFPKRPARAARVESRDRVFGPGATPVEDYPFS